MIGSVGACGNGGQPRRDLLGGVVPGGDLPSVGVTLESDCEDQKQ